MARPAKSAPLRRSTRVQARIPVVISGTLPEGTAFTEETHILTVSKFGARVKTKHALKAGMQVAVQPKRNAEEKSTPAKIVWVGREGTPREGEIGLEYLDPANPFGVNFP